MNDLQSYVLFFCAVFSTIMLWQIKGTLEKIKDEIVGELTEKHKNDYTHDG